MLPIQQMTIFSSLQPMKCFQTLLLHNIMEQCIFSFFYFWKNK